MNSISDRTQCTIAWLPVIILLRFARDFYWDKRWQNNKRVYKDFFVNVYHIYAIYDKVFFSTYPFTIECKNKRIARSFATTVGRHCFTKYIQLTLNIILIFGRESLEHLYGTSVRPSVMDVLWLNGRSYEKLFTQIISRVLNLGKQNFSDLVQGKHFQIWGWIEER